MSPELGTHQVGSARRAIACPSSEEGFSEDEVDRFVREKLDGVAVHIVTRTGALRLQGAPTLYLQSSLLETTGESIYVVELELVHGVYLEREEGDIRGHAVRAPAPGSALDAPTWRARAIGVTKRGHLADIRDEIGAVTDVFARDFVGT